MRRGATQRTEAVIKPIQCYQPQLQKSEIDKAEESYRARTCERRRKVKMGRERIQIRQTRRGT